MTTNNPELFDKCVTIIFATLYQKFPLQIELDFNDLAIELWEDGDNDEKYFNIHEIFANTVSWLVKSGYIWAEKVDAYNSYGTVLSPAGLELLKMPSSLSKNTQKSQKTIGEDLIETMKSGAKDVAKDLIKKGLTEGFKFLLYSSSM